ncbi:MAG: hypothetical protein IJ644_04585 [Oscillospiraceae bacterium]|nr:hypothetical protein [Oscillospiraceae bacterium]
MTRKKFIILSSIVLFLILSFLCAVAYYIPESAPLDYNAERVAESYGITLDETAQAESFERYYGLSHEAYVLKITDISNVNAWCQKQENWNVMEFDNSFMLLNNERYMHQGILKAEDCVYVVSLDNNIDDVQTVFYDLYS